MDTQTPSIKCLLNFIADQSNDAIRAAVFDYFRKHGCVREISGVQVSDFAPNKWPAVPGVYLVRRRESGEVLYIGMTGQVKGRNGAAASVAGGRLSHRAGRWTPYVFQASGTYADHWECGPNFKETRRPPALDNENYRHHFPLKSIVVECIDLSTAWREVSPTFLEALLIQAHLSETGSLPLGNQVL